MEKEERERMKEKKEVSVKYKSSGAVRDKWEAPDKNMVEVNGTNHPKLKQNYSENIYISNKNKISDEGYVCVQRWLLMCHFNLGSTTKVSMKMVLPPVYGGGITVHVSWLKPF